MNIFFQFNESFDGVVSCTSSCQFDRINELVHKFFKEVRKTWKWLQKRCSFVRSANEVSIARAILSGIIECINQKYKRLSAPYVPKHMQMCPILRHISWTVIVMNPCLSRKRSPFRTKVMIFKQFDTHLN